MRFPLRHGVERKLHIANGGRRSSSISRPHRAPYAVLVALVIAGLACAQSNVQGTPGLGDVATAVPPSPTLGAIVAPTLAVISTAPPPSSGETPDPALEVTSEAPATPLPEIPGPSDRLMPDTEVVYGPSAATFDIGNYVLSQGGALANYTEKVFNEDMSGADIVRLVALDYSVNPRLLLALLENQTNFVSVADVNADARRYPLAKRDSGREGLYHQLAWAADTLNQAYYGWKEGRLNSITFTEERIIFDAGLNPGTVALQFFFSHYYTRPQTWLFQLGPDGLTGTYNRMFGDPFANAVEPLVPSNLIQLPMSLPWDSTETWYFLGGPHGAYEAGSAWAALDFGPPVVSGCGPNPTWLRAASPGIIARSDHGVVVLDIDFPAAGPLDGLEQTGWALFYLHVATFERIPVGTVVNTGDPIGHPGCEGGEARGAHLHIARKFNGEWIPAAGPLPFNLSGWTPTGGSIEYAGDLVGGEYTLTACECRSNVNAIRGVSRIP